MIHKEDVLFIYEFLNSHGIPIWLSGGWGIDALLGKQTRPHKDLDVIILKEDVKRMLDCLGSQGFTLVEIWTENRWVNDSQGNEIPTAFVLGDAARRQVDAHAIYLDRQGNGIPAWEETEGFFFTASDLEGKGFLAGKTVQCLTPQSQLKCHTGYKIPEKQLRDLEQLQEKFRMR